MPATRNKIAANLEHIRETIADACRRSGRSPREVSIIAVTKTVELDSIKHLVELGLTDLGESRVQHLTQRAEELSQWLARRQTASPAPRWHMIGHLQRNKVKQVLDHSRIIHSVDSLRLAEEINARAEKMGQAVDALLQVNCSQEQQKFGCAVGAALHMAELVSTLKHVRLVGLMTMAEMATDPEKARPAFALLRELFEELRNEKVGGDAFRHLSMGMSHDYPVAVEEGATLLRIGAALFE